MSITELKLEIKSILSETCNQTRLDKLNICADIYQKLVKFPAVAVDALQWFFENSEKIESSNSKTASSYISETTSKKLHKQYSELVDALFEQILSKNLPVEIFYQKIWEIITTAPSFDDDDARIFALYYIWIDARVPYFKLEDGLFMSNKEFQECSELLHTTIQKARFILRTNLFEQRTSRASVLLSLIEGLKTEQEKAVLMAHILSISSPPTMSSRTLRDMLDKLLDDSAV